MAEKTACPTCGKVTYSFLHSCPGVPQRPMPDAHDTETLDEERLTEPYNGLSLAGNLRSAYRTAEQQAQRTGYRHRIHRVALELAGTPIRGWHICEVEHCRHATLEAPL